MSMLTLRCRASRAVLFAAAVLAPALFVQPASAAVVSYPGACARKVDVVQWAPKSGAVARFVADTFAKSTSTGLWIGLGRTDTAFWSAEGGDPNDACDGCRELSLVETKFDGTRTSHKILGSSDFGRLESDPAKLKAHVLAKLWKLAAKAWPADKLQQTYTFTIGKPPAKDPDRAPPFVVEVAPKDAAKLRFELNAKTSMCWCEYEWKAKKVATTK